MGLDTNLSSKQVEWNRSESLIHGSNLAHLVKKWNFALDAISRGMKDIAALRTRFQPRIPTDKNQPGYSGVDTLTEAGGRIICTPNIFRLGRKSGVPTVRIQIPESISL